MRETTLKAIIGLVQADPIKGDADRAELMKALGHKPQTTPDRVLRYKEAALRLGCTSRNIIRLVSLGRLCPVMLPGQTRASGIRESEIDRLILGA